jgi:hypothetical protein
MIAIGAIMILTIFIRTSKNRKEVKNEKENWWT